MTQNIGKRVEICQKYRKQKIIIITEKKTKQNLLCQGRQEQDYKIEEKKGRQENILS